MEIWKECDWLDGYAGILSVSNRGRVRRSGYTYTCLGRWGTEHTTTKPDKILSTYVEKDGYATVAVQIAGRRKRFRMHYLIGRAFVPGYAPHLCINHIDGNKTNNTPENLEWVTIARNTERAWQTGLVNLRGDLNPSRKLSSGQVRIIRRLLKIGASRGELATLCGVSASNIELIDKGLRWNSVS